MKEHPVRVAMIACAIGLSGCTAIGVGRVAVPYGPNVVVTSDNHASLTTSNTKILLAVGGYDPDLVMFGPIIPIIPISPSMPGLGLTKSEKTILQIKIEPEQSTFNFDPQSIQIIVAGNVNKPTYVSQNAGCSGSSNETASIKSTEVSEATCYTATFGTLPPPTDDFTVHIANIPSTQWRVRRDVAAGAIQQK